MPRSATIEPMLPQPITPSVLPKISTPMNLFFSHLPARVETSASGICRASASIIESACSAVVMELPNGVFITITPLAVAAGMSTLSTPMPARPITFRFLAFSRIFGDTLVAERMARPSKWPTSSASLSLSLPRFGWKSTSVPRSLKICTAAGESASEISTLGVIWSCPLGVASAPFEERLRFVSEIVFEDAARERSLFALAARRQKLPQPGAKLLHERLPAFGGTERHQKMRRSPRQLHLRKMRGLDRRHALHRRRQRQQHVDRIRIRLADLRA